ncbi:bifunctional hydroxymethylpyrimidine kinase/phosphomethylpyrimidine kinase [Epidermidibacterium keratini]|uniref:Bifunctional hydroxymethylpyrimidine kinase/phosphomethylpyrimidine kinase n=1 Tax=Epidermidibacterium keratini TaxID=1891644 RepID=A0A7L4YJF8_9ACTN|nr:bifunctional hydroxymethylpyrimidine kinase/phosphomethylpyrimidine kinase [Epidermidibacterium keratini]QHB99434.1 bifunctional hydroxymethylpyrimidine kinase/phosphomethylpyrimidine kinase [Epidermidibacterium keratini]
MTTPPPVALSIAGTDPSGGAGIQADLKTFSALGAYGTTVITALVAQATQGVRGIEVVDPDFLRLQWRTLVDDVRIDAIKIGMLANAEIADTVGEFLTESLTDTVVLDPVMVAASGDRLLDPQAEDAVRRLLPAASLITPNLPEAAVLLGSEPADSVEQMRAQAADLLELGAVRVLLKGGHLEGDGLGESVDVYADGEQVVELTAPLIDTKNTHGTGCTLSSAIAALRPQRGDWLSSVSEAKDYLTGALAAADTLDIGRGSGPVHHFYQVWKESS